MAVLQSVTVEVVCPDCPAEVPITVPLTLVTCEHGHQWLRLGEPDYTDLWAHTWSHQEAPDA